MSPDPAFHLCLTHDVDRPYKTFQAPYFALRERDPSHLRALLPGENPYWQFDEIMALEADLGVRSAFYFLDERHLFDLPPSEWLSPANWVRYTGRYDLTASDVADAVRRLDRGGWEVGLHGSFSSYRQKDRLREEKSTLEGVLGHPVRGVRQHYLNLSVPETWTYHADLDLDYDASVGSAEEYGFRFGYRPHRPFNDDFLVFPLTIMECALPDPGDSFRRAWRACEDLLAEARENDAVMTVLWHPRFFNESEFPGYRSLYRRLIESALDAGAWVGPPGDCYDRLVE